MIEATAPSNIALIKYMGKTAGNLPTNSSLSFTLDHLLTKVRIQSHDHDRDDVVSLSEGGFKLELSEKGKMRFLDFFAKLKSEFGITGFYRIESGNNFPSDCGLASSASSFAALTKATYLLGLKCGRVDDLSNEQLSRLSQRGSGSSCRSFFSPFALWKTEGAVLVDVGVSGFQHAALILEDRKKEVSSSEAHLRVASSALFQGRAARAENRLQELTRSLESGAWKVSFELCWQEFWDMHALFETSSPPFGYMNGPAVETLNFIRSIWNESEGPLVTMDAGPNIHLLFRPDQDRDAFLGKLKGRFAGLKLMAT